MMGHPASERVSPYSVPVITWYRPGNLWSCWAGNENGRPLARPAVTRLIKFAFCAALPEPLREHYLFPLKEGTQSGTLD